MPTEISTHVFTNFPLETCEFLKEQLTRRLAVDSKAADFQSAPTDVQLFMHQEFDKYYAGNFDFTVEFEKALRHRDVKRVFYILLFTDMNTTSQFQEITLIIRQLDEEIKRRARPSELRQYGLGRAGSKSTANHTTGMGTTYRNRMI